VNTLATQKSEVFRYKLGQIHSRIDRQRGALIANPHCCGDRLIAARPHHRPGARCCRRAGLVEHNAVALGKRPGIVPLALAGTAAALPGGSGSTYIVAAIKGMTYGVPTDRLVVRQAVTADVRVSGRHLGRDAKSRCYFTICVRRPASRSGGMSCETRPTKRPAGSIMWMTEVWSTLYSPSPSSCRRAWMR
jgi:hypothetical protein